ncbi:MAG: GIY-YIG nuclease family protein [Parasporobacterium sp.]|nr:GIY-YIG nuclease family protein [Parasporobacterium sp.]
MKKIVENAEECTVDEFFTIKSSANDFVGVYVLYNKTKDMFYVGQSKNVYKRVSNHLNGKGNGDVYADFKYGNHFTIRVIPLAGSGYTSLNQLERHYIDYYKAFSKGYNKNRGNKD